VFVETDELFLAAHLEHRREFFELREQRVDGTARRLRLGAPVREIDRVGFRWRRRHNARTVFSRHVLRIADGKPKNTAVQGYADGLQRRLEEAKPKVPPLVKPARDATPQ